MGPGMSADVRKEVLEETGRLGRQAGQFRRRRLATASSDFDFAKDMGIETIVSEPAEDAFDAIDKLCDEYGINVAIHNHPKPSHYWNPETVLKVCKGRSKRIGACADTGHWMRSGLNPVECLKKLEGRIISFHFKDLNKMGPTPTTCPGAPGECDVQGDAHRDPPPGDQGRVLDRVRVQLGQLGARDRQVRGVLRQDGRRTGRKELTPQDSRCEEPRAWAF